NQRRDRHFIFHPVLVFFWCRTHFARIRRRFRIVFRLDRAMAGRSVRGLGATEYLRDFGPVRKAWHKKRRTPVVRPGSAGYCPYCYGFFSVGLAGSDFGAGVALGFGATPPNPPSPAPPRPNSPRLPPRPCC